MERATDTAVKPVAQTAAKKRRRGGAHRSLLLLAAGHALVLGAIFVGNTVGPENWWPSALNLYVPQGVWAIPAVILLPLFLARAPRRAWLPLLCLLWAAGPTMGFRWRWTPANGGPKVAGQRLRVMTYNVKDGLVNPWAATQAIADAHPDLLFAQEAAAARGHLNRVIAHWNVRHASQFLIASRFPLSDPEIRSLSSGNADSDCLRCRVRVGDTMVTVYCAHLLTPRPGLRALRAAEEECVPTFTSNTDTRLEQAATLEHYVRSEKGPVILAGDLNAPVQSIACRSLFAAGMRDAFSEAGRGYGYTYGHRYAFGYDYVRIDHIMVSPEWRVLDCKAGPKKGSDHCPVIADILLPAEPR